MLRTWIIHNHIHYENCFDFSGLLRRWLGRAAFLRLWRGKIFLHLEKVKNLKILKVQKLFWNYFWFLKYSKNIWSEFFRFNNHEISKVPIGVSHREMPMLEKAIYAKHRTYLSELSFTSQSPNGTIFRY